MHLQFTIIIRDVMNNTVSDIAIVKIIKHNHCDLMQEISKFRAKSVCFHGTV